MEYSDEYDETKRRRDRLSLHDDIEDFGDDNAFRDDSSLERMISTIDGDAERRDAEEQQRREYLTRLIKKAMKHLTDRQREYIELSFYENKSDCEIQAIWGCIQQNVSKVKIAAIKKLKKVMKSYQQMPKSGSENPSFSGYSRER